MVWAFSFDELLASTALAAVLGVLLAYAPAPFADVTARVLVVLENEREIIVLERRPSAIARRH